MKSKEILFIILLSLIIVCLFFYKSVLFHQIPFPGDILVGSAPYKTQSYLGYAPGGYPNLAQGMDVVTEMFPWKYFMTQELKAGRLPFWNPHNFSGNLHMQNYQTAIFYPFNIFFFLFSFATAWSLFIMLQPFLAMLFMYLFLKSLHINKFASVIGGIAFAFSSYMTVWIEYGNIGATLLWLPLVLFALTKFIEEQRLLYFLLAIFSLTMSFLAGYIQGVFYIYILAIAYIVYTVILRRKEFATGATSKKQVLLEGNDPSACGAITSKTFRDDKQSVLSKKKVGVSNKQFRSGLHPKGTIYSVVAHTRSSIKILVSLLLILILSILLSAFQILPTYDLFSSSTRSTYSLSQISFLLQPLYYWITIFAPDFFGNPAHRNYFLPITYIERVMYFSVPLIFFVLLGIFGSKEKTMRFFLIIGFFVLVCTTNIPFIQYIYRLPIPMISTTVPTRALSIFIFCMIIVASFGVDYWLSKTTKQKNILPLIFIGIYACIWLLTLIVPKIFPDGTAHKSIMVHNLVIPTVLAVATVIVFYLKKFSTRVAVILLLFLVIFDLFSFFQKITPFSLTQLIYPQTPVITYLQKNAGINRFWGYGSAYIPANFQTYDGTYSPEGNDPLHIKDYGTLLASSSNGVYPNLLPRPDANVAPGYGMTDMRNPYRQQILNLLGVKYVLNVGDSSRVFPEDTYSLIWQKNPWQIYENKKVLARYFLSSQYQVSSDPKDTLAKIYTTDLSHVVLLNTKPSRSVYAGSTGTVSLVSYLPDQAIFATNTTGNTLLFLSDNYYHSWIAKIDNVITPIYKADFTFRAVVVPKGNHTVSFIYEPSYFYVGLYIAGFGLVITILYSLYVFKYEKTKK